MVPYQCSMQMGVVWVPVSIPRVQETAPCATADFPDIYQGNRSMSAAREPGCASPAYGLWKLPGNQLSKTDLSHGKYMGKRLFTTPLEIHFASVGAIYCTGLFCIVREGLVKCMHKVNIRNWNFPLQIPQTNFSLLPASLHIGLSFLKEMTWCWKCWR